MKNHYALIAFAILGLLCYAPLNAQSDQGKKVKTQFLQLPNYDLNSVDLVSISVEYAVGPTSFGQEKLQDTKSQCVPKGGGLKDVKEVTTYYYAVPFNKPATFMVAKDSDGKIVYAEQVTPATTAPANFGFNECKYWFAETMKKDYAANGEKFKQQTVAAAHQEIAAAVDQSIRRNVFPSFVYEEFDVFTAKGKAFDYSELDQAQEMAMGAYESFREQGPNAQGIDQLKSAIQVWEKEVAQLDEEDKKARINKSVGKGLYENLANAYLYVYDVDAAIKAGTAGLALFGNFSNNRSQALEMRIEQLRTHQLAVKQNEAIAQDASQLNALGQKAGSGSFLLNKAPDTDFGRLESEFESFRVLQAKDKYDAAETMHEEAVAAGEVNPYERYVTETATQGRMLMISPLLMQEKLSAFPKEICAMTDLKQVTITNNEIASIPPEIKQMGALKKLNLNGNQLTSLPAEIGEMASLETLNLSNNPLSEIPSEIQNCKSLKKLTLKGTKLSSEQQAQLQEWLPNAKIKY